MAMVANLYVILAKIDHGIVLVMEEVWLKIKRRAVRILFKGIYCQLNTILRRRKKKEEKC